MTTTAFKSLLAGAVLSALVTGCTQETTPEAYLARAEAALAEDDTASAIIELKNSLKGDSSNTRARLLLGLAYFDSGNIRAAEKELMLAGEPESVEDRSRLQAALAQTWVDMAKFDDVLGLSLKDLTPEGRATVLAAKGQAYIARSDLKAAQQRVSSALELDPDSVYALYTGARLDAIGGDSETAYQRLEQLVAVDPDYAPAWALRGDLDWRESQVEAADEAYSRAVKLAPMRPQYRMQRAFSRIGAENYEGAQKDLDTLLKVAPQNTQVNYAQGLLYFRQGEYQRAVSAFVIAEADKFSFPEVLLYLGLSHAQLGDRDKAYSYAREFHALDEDSVGGNRFLASLLVSRGEAAEAEAMARDLLVGNPQDVSALNTLASALISQQRTDEAIQVLSQVAELNPDSAQAQMRLGAGYLTAGRSEEAVGLVESAIDIDPESGEPDTILVLTHLRNEDYPAALKAAQDFADRKPDSPQPQVLMGMVYKKMADIDAAKQAFQAATELGPGNPAANQQLAAIAFSAGDLDAARGYYRSVLAEHKDYLPTLIALAALEGFDRNFSEMEKVLEQAKAAHPEALQPRLALARYYLAAGQPERVQVMFSDLSRESASEPPVLRVEAMAQLATGAFKEAQFTLEGLFKQEEPSVRDRRMMAYSLEQQGKGDEAQTQLLLAAEQAPENLELQLSLARYALREGDQAAFDEHLARMLEIAPESPNVVQLQAVKARRDGDQAQALALFQRAQELQPGTAGVVNLLQQYDLMGNRDEATALLESWSSANAGDTAAKGLLALRLQESGDTAGAIGKYEEFLEADPDNVAALNNLAWLLRDTQTERALTYARKAEQLSKGAPTVRDTLAMTLISAGKYDEAGAILDDLVAKQPDEPAYRYHQAVLATKLGDAAGARELLETLLSGDPQFNELEDARALLATLNSSQ